MEESYGIKRKEKIMGGGEKSFHMAREKRRGIND